jgi:ribosomal protein RSM22 (predicted rRNA methylase)
VLDSRAAQAAYLVMRLPATFAAASFVLQDCAERSGGEVESILDLGAGLGAASWAACSAFASVRQITLIEKNSDLIDTGKRLASNSHYGALKSAEWIGADLADYMTECNFDLAIASYSIGELSVAAQQKLLEQIWPRARALAIIEPGTPRGFRHVLAARRSLIAQGARIAAPCPGEHACPLAEKNDWCHFAVRLERTSLHRRLKAGELGYEDEKFSYVVAAKGRPWPAAARIVRHPLHLKGHTRLELCTLAGLQQITVTRSHGETYKRAKKAKWGEEWES